MRNLCVASIILLLSSCSAGLMFNHKKAAELDLNQMRSAEYTDIFGDPFRTSNVITADGKYQYAWYHSALRDYFIGPVCRRNLFLEFKDDQLNAYLYTSTFDEDKTEIDLNKVDLIKIGTSTKNDVLTLIGKPYGKALCPSMQGFYKDMCVKASEIWAWFQFGKTSSIASNDPRGNPLGSKSLFVLFDASGHVIDLKATDNKD